MVILLWVPVGAGGHVVRHTSRWWEWAQSRRQRRAAQRLFHAVVEVTVDGTRFVVEMAPSWGGPRTADRGVVRTGPVGWAPLGRWAAFRYEVRCWRDGVIPDRRWTEGDPVTLTTDPSRARTLVERTHEVPPLTWGRTVGSTGDMWNSNSVVSWLAATSGIEVAGVRPPAGGSAPGWEAGLAVAAHPTLGRMSAAGGS